MVPWTYVLLYEVLWCATNAGWAGFGYAIRIVDAVIAGLCTIGTYRVHLRRSRKLCSFCPAEYLPCRISPSDADKHGSYSSRDCE